MKGFQTFADASAATGLVANTAYWVAGQTEVGDFGQGWFVYSRDSQAAPGTNAIEVANGGRLLRVTSTQNSSGEFDTGGNPMPSGMPTAYAYNADGTVDTLTKTNGIDTWVMTFSYISGRLASDSGWVKS